ACLLNSVVYLSRSEVQRVISSSKDLFFRRDAGWTEVDPVGWAVVAGAVEVLLASPAGVVAVVAPAFVPNKPDAAVADAGVAVVVDAGTAEAVVLDGPAPNRPPP